MDVVYRIMHIVINRCTLYTHIELLPTSAKQRSLCHENQPGLPDFWSLLIVDFRARKFELEPN